jgi:2-aminoadipate transaminase
MVAIATPPDYRLATESAHLQRSVMRELLKRAGTPGVISLAGGLPDSALLPAEDYATCVTEVIRRDGGRALQYYPMYEPLRAWIAERMTRRGVVCTSEQVFITNGNQQGLNILSRLFLDPGDLAVTEAFTFTGVGQVTAGRGAEVIGVPVDFETGVDLDALEAAFARQPRMAVLIPTFQNPLGVTIPDAHRVRIAELAAEYRVPVIEDDPYSELAFDGIAPTPIKAYDADGWVFYLGSFSKMLAPGLRLGFMIAPQALASRIVTLRESLDLESSTLTQRAVHEFLSRGLLTPHLKRLNAANGERCATLLSVLDIHFGDLATWTRPTGGLFVWMQLDDTSYDAFAALNNAIDNHGVAYVPGGAFSMTGGQRHTLRLNFSAVVPDQISEGVHRLKSALFPSDN